MKTRQAAVLDDDVDFLVYIKQMLNTFGIHSETFSEGRTFLDRIPHRPFDLIFLDMMMAEQDGVQILEALSELALDIPVVLVSSSEQKVIDSAAQFGDFVGVDIAGTLRKPFWRGEIGNLLERFENRPAASRQLSEGTIQDALDDGRLRVHYQPIVDFNELEIVGIEALSRLELDDGELAMPAQFLRTVESRDLIRPLTLKVIEQVVSDLARFSDDGLTLRASINMGINLLELELLPDLIRKTCEQAGVPPSQMMVEVSEGSVSENLRTVLRGATRFRLLNIGLSIDDFGKAFSTEERLKRLPFNELKIDGDLIGAMTRDSDARDSVRRAIELGRQLGVAVVAEGVETAQIKQTLLGLDCPRMQGFQIARPMPATELTRWIREWPPESTPK